MAARDAFNFEDSEVYPLEASASGDNAYYLKGCETVGHRPAYAACIRKVEARKNGRLDTAYADCSAAIGKKECPAARMREQELAKGVAIFFISRPKLNEYVAERQGEADQMLTAKLGGEAPKKASKRPAYTPPKAVDDFDTGSYADAINSAIKETAKAPEAPKIQPKPAVSRPPMLPGESPLAYVKRIREMQSA